MGFGVLISRMLGEHNDEVSCGYGPPRVGGLHPKDKTLCEPGVWV
jgi:hypothetical protein